MRKRLLRALGLAAFCFIAEHVGAARSEDAGLGVLRVCLNENLLPYSVRRGDSGTGFDLMIAESVAKRIERPLVVQWFGTKLDTDSRSAVEASALLSDARCDLLGGYPLIKDALGSPGPQSGRLPDFAGAKASDRRRQVKLGALAATRPYHFAPLTVVLGAKAASRSRATALFVSLPSAAMRRTRASAVSRAYTWLMMSESSPRISCSSAMCTW